MFPVANGVPLRYPPVVTWALIATDVIALLFEVSLNPSELDEFLYRFAPVPARHFEAGMFDGSLSATDYLALSTMFCTGVAAPECQPWRARGSPASEHNPTSSWNTCRWIHCGSTRGSATNLWPKRRTLYPDRAPAL
jgi:hypothetical protein